MSRLKTIFEKSRVVGPLHTGGPVAIASDGQHIVTCVGEEVVLTRLADGQELRRFTSDSETIHSLCLTPSSSHLIVFTASMSMHIFEDPLSTTAANKSIRPSRTISKAHDAPVHVCKADPNSTLLASGSADGVVKVWDIRNGYVTHVFKGHGGVVSALCFRYVYDTSSATNSKPIIQLVSASVDTRLRVFDLSYSGNGKPIAIMEGHVSVPRGLDVTTDGRWLISGGRDSVVLLWDFVGDKSSSLTNKRKDKEGVCLTPALSRTIPALERVEAIGWVDQGDGVSRFFTAGEKGIVKVWDAHKGALLFSISEGVDLSKELDEQREIVDACFMPSNSAVLSVHADQNILFHSLSSKSLTRQLIGYNDEIIGATFLTASGTDSHIAIAANSSLIRVYSAFENDARLLSGHSGMVLCLDHSADRRLLASGSKDKSARIWSFSVTAQSWSCSAICEGHAESVGAVALSRKLRESGSGLDAPRFMFTASQDRTIKMWDLSSGVADTTEIVRCKSLSTHKAHEKDINSLDVSPNDLLLASGSQDRTAKVYEIAFTQSGGTGGAKGDIKLLGTCKGHKRGVWSVKFGKVERVLATGSGDKSIKLWNLDDFSCVKTFEGHTNSVLQVDFLSQDSQLVSSASDGLLKLWNIRAEECVATMDNHEDKVWALTVSSDCSTIVTGAADSIITFWRDCTQENEHEQQAIRERAVLREQDYMNYVSMKDYQNAILLALAMDQPGRLLSIFKTIFGLVADSSDGAAHADSVTGHHGVDVVLRNLPPIELVTLLRHTRDWNTNSSTSTTAQSILHAIFKLRTTEDIAAAFELKGSGVMDMKTPPAASGTASSLGDIVRSLLPYTERHLARLDRLVQDSYILDYVLGEMDGGVSLDGGMDIDL